MYNQSFYLLKKFECISQNYEKFICSIIIDTKFFQVLYNNFLMRNDHDYQGDEKKNINF